jgi:hypothetical protein
MKTKDQQLLELLYEQVVEGSRHLLPEEKKFSEAAAKIISKQIFTAVEGRIHNNGKLDFEYLGGLIDTHFDKALDIFSPDYDHFVRRVVRVHLAHDLFNRLVFIKTIDGKINVCFRPAKFVTTDQYNEDRLFIPIENKQEVEDQLRKTIEGVILERYDYFLKYPRSSTSNETKWVEWRKEKLKYKALTDEHPELEGIF